MTPIQTHLIRLGAAALASAAALGALGGAAGASTHISGHTGSSGANAAPATLAGIKERASVDITDRVNDLGVAIARVNATQGLGSEQSVLDADLGADIDPLRQLNQVIQADTSVAQAAKDFSSIFSGFRVYALVLPAAWIAADADHATVTAIPSLTSAATRARAHVNPSNQGVLQPLIDDLNAQITSATNATNGLAGNVLAFTPAQWNANHDLLSSSKSAQQAANHALDQGRSDVHQIVTDLVGGNATPRLRGAGTGANLGAPTT
jgi:hypothetical protein